MEGQCSETKHNDSQNNRQNDEATTEKIEFDSDNTTTKIQQSPTVREDHQASKSTGVTILTCCINSLIQVIWSLKQLYGLPGFCDNYDHSLEYYVHIPLFRT